MSGLPPIATVEPTSRFDSFVPTGDSCIAKIGWLFLDIGLLMTEAASLGGLFVL